MYLHTTVNAEKYDYFEPKQEKWCIHGRQLCTAVVLTCCGGQGHTCLIITRLKGFPHACVCLCHTDQETDQTIHVIVSCNVSSWPFCDRGWEKMGVSHTNWPKYYRYGIEFSAPSSLVLDWFFVLFYFINIRLFCVRVLFWMLFCVWWVFVFLFFANCLTRRPWAAVQTDSVCFHWVSPIFRQFC